MIVLDLKMQPNDASAETVRDYLKALLSALVEEGECFDSKHPFGNSGWEYDLLAPLTEVEGGATEISARNAILAAIKSL